MGRQTSTRTRFFRRNLGVVLRQRRLEMNLSQEDLAWAVEVTQGTISNYESGRSEVPLSILIGMCEQLQLDPNDLLDVFRQTGRPAGPMGMSSGVPSRASI